MSKENLKPNKIEAPTLFVGLGGTGCQIVKMVADMCRPEEMENINFLCLDTNVNDLMAMKANGNIYYIQTSNTQTVGNYLYYDDDALKNWFPKNAILYDKTVSEGAGQVRAISRLALNSTIKTGKIMTLYDAIDDLYHKTGAELNQAMRVVMVSTTSGGTGSGIILPMSMFIRDYVKNKYPNASLIVRGMLLLPETLDSVIKSNVERKSQRRNAYATIKELNAFMMKGSGFFDIAEDLKRYSGLHIDFSVQGSDERKSLSLLPFDFCFLMDGQDAEDKTLISFSQYKKQAAIALYEQNIGPMSGKAFSVEDNIIKEMSNPGVYGRNRFGGIGASILRYPYKDVVDYVTCNWALDSVGGEGESSKWCRFDNDYLIEKREAEQKGTPRDEMRTLGQFYVDRLNSLADGGQKFSKDLRGKYLNDATDRIDKFFETFEERMFGTLQENESIKSGILAAKEAKEEKDYSNKDEHGKALDKLEGLESFRSAVEANTERLARGFAESILLNERKTINVNEDYTIEKALKNVSDDICHPNAARYMLYSLMAEFEKRRDEAGDAAVKALDNLAKYDDDAGEADLFDAAHTRKHREDSLRALCEVEKGADQKLTIQERLSKYKEIYDKFNEHFPAYYRNINNLMENKARFEAYKIGYNYTKELCEMYERFFSTFKDKVRALTRKKEDIADILKFRKGDSIMNVCSSVPILEKLSQGAIRTASGDGDMLDSELNGQIFDAIKANVKFERESRYAESMEEDQRIDIFDDILFVYFRNSVEKNCDDIDMNIIEAIARENVLNDIIKKEKTTDDKETKVFSTLTADDNIRYIKNMVAKGARLAAPSIQRITGTEPREINVCAYNKSLLDMRKYRVKDILQNNSEASDTVSKYELHFFNALYNLTPDKLNKFASPLTVETGTRSAGLYHEAYMEYAKRIGPDSTKDIATSTHIDKRWDSLAVMPELDFDFQTKRIIRIHKALIYALVYRLIRHQSLSVNYPKKKVYRYENTEERQVDLVVSNGTLCDEFYEILDALYSSSATVEDIYAAVKKKTDLDVLSNSNYEESFFAESMKDFYLDAVHEGETSIFEIPLVHYNSLPNSKRFLGEMSDLVNAAVEVLSDEVFKCEKGADAKFLLCEKLEAEFALLLKNYEKYPVLRSNTSASDNMVIDLVLRKIRKVMSEAPEPADFEKTIAGLKKRVLDADKNIKAGK